MDIIEHSESLSLVPVPYLAPAFAVFKSICSSVEQVQALASKRQLGNLTQVVSQLLRILDAEYRSGRLVPTTTFNLKTLDHLIQLLEDIAAFIQKQCTQSFLKTLLTMEDRISRIDRYHRRIDRLANTFEVSARLRIDNWQSRIHNARIEDQRILIAHLNNLEAESNQNQLLEALNAQQSNMMAMMASLQRHLDERSATDQERHFLSHSLHYLSTHSGQHVKLEHWMVTALEVEFGSRIGAGEFGQVFHGLWNKTEVALKVLKTQGGIMPSSTSIRHVISTWSKLTHPNIIQFLGANILDDKPFFVMPYVKNGNVRDYIEVHPDCNRAKILCDMSLGLIYLHAHKIVHGDIKALNVLMDEGGKAVLCDFGLSQVRADVTSQTMKADAAIIIGSHNWMAPERLLGGSLENPSDIYAYGMTIYEIYANETPLGDISYDDFIDLVVHNDVRPERPDAEDAPQLNDDIWQLAEQCWAKHAHSRPDASGVCDSITHVLDTARVGQAPPGQINMQPAPSPVQPLLRASPPGSVVSAAQHFSTDNPELDWNQLLEAPNASFESSNLMQTKVYENLCKLLEEKIYAQALSPDDHYKRLFNTLQELINDIAGNDTVTNLVHTHKYHLNLLEIASNMGCQNDPGIREALKQDELMILNMLQHVVQSTQEKEVVFRLRGEDAEKFLNLLQSIAGGSDNGMDHVCRAAHRMHLKLSIDNNLLPSDVFIEGVDQLEQEPRFGGGFADIYHAMYCGQEVAVKKLRIFQMHDERSKIHRDVCREALVWKRFDHPSILPFLGVDRETFPNFLCMVSPWLRNGTILTHIKHNGRSNVNIDKHLMEIALGVEYLHSQKFVHGDLRGVNVLIDNEWHARLTDFGLAGFGETTMATNTSRHRGSARWMAPELFMPGEYQLATFRRTFHTDVYAFGCVCLEVYTGHHPFSDVPNEMQVLFKLSRRERPKRPDGTSNSQMSDEMWGIVESCLCPEPTDRLSMAEILRSMEAHNIG